MIPSSASNYVANRHLGNPKLTGEFDLLSAGRAQSSDLSDSLFIENGAPIGAAKILTAPTLADHVIGVLRRRSDEEVVRAHAATIVAVVEHPEAIRHLPEVEHPGDAVHAAEGSRLVLGQDVDVATLRGYSGENPTGSEIWAMGGDRPVLVDTRPESGDQWCTLSGHRSSLLRCHAPDRSSHRCGGTLRPNFTTAPDREG